MTHYGIWDTENWARPKSNHIFYLTMCLIKACKEFSLRAHFSLSCLLPPIDPDAAQKPVREDLSLAALHGQHKTQEDNKCLLVEVSKKSPSSLSYLHVLGKSIKHHKSE